MEDVNFPVLLKEFANYLESNGYAILAKPYEIDLAIEEFLEMKG